MKNKRKSPQIKLIDDVNNVVPLVSDITDVFILLLTSATRTRLNSIRTVRYISTQLCIT